MIGWTMRQLPVGGFVWLALHELRLAFRNNTRKPLARIIGWVLLIAWCGIGAMIGLALRDIGIPQVPLAMTIVATIAVGMLTFMITQAMLASQRTLYEAGDLDLLFSAPLAPRRVVAAKLAGIVATVTLTFAFIVLPVMVPVAVLGHPEFLGVPLLVLGLALVSACFGLALTLLLARIAGPRAARTVGQVFAALAGGAVFLVSQFMGGGRGDRQSGMEILFERMREAGFGTHGLSALPGRAAFGDPLAVAAVIVGGLALFAATAWAMQTWFLSSYRSGRMRLGGRGRKATSKVAKHFHASLTRTVFAKEWRLLSRDPALAFQIVLRLIYLAPILLVAMRSEGAVPLAPSLAFSSVIIAGQLVGSLAWLAASAEDSPDLIAVSPVEKSQLDEAKLFAAMAMAAPLALLLPIGIALETIPGAIVTLVFTAIAGGLTGWLEVTNAKPMPRSTFQRKGSGSILLAFFEFIIAAILGLVAGVVVYFL